VTFATTASICDIAIASRERTKAVGLALRAAEEEIADVAENLVVVLQRGEEWRPDCVYDLKRTNQKARQSERGRGSDRGTGM
jgi:hypothetical protein